MALARKIIADPVYETVMRHGGPGHLLIHMKETKAARKFDQESEMINRKATRAAEVCYSNVMDYSLLRDPHAVFASSLQLAQSNYHFQQSFASSPNPETRERAETRKREIIEGYDLELSILKQKRDTLEAVRRTQGEGEYGTDFLRDSLSAVSSAVSRMGVYGRIEIYSHVLGWLDGHTRRLLPQSGEFIDLMIKSMMVRESNLRVRENAWLNADIRDRDSLKLGDLLRPSTRKHHASKKSI